MRKTKVCDGASNYFVEEVERVTGIDPPCLITSLPRLRRKKQHNLLDTLAGEVEERMDALVET